MRKRTVMALFLVLTMLGLVACSTSKPAGEPAAPAPSGGTSEPGTQPAAPEPAAGAPRQLNLLVWEGYADPHFVEAFEKEHNVKINAAYMGSSDELVAKIAGGGDTVFDLISPSSDVAGVLVDQGLVAEIDLSQVPTYGKLSEKLRNLPLVRRGDKVYGVPFTWGPDPLIYNADVFTTPPDSWAVFWDPQYAGKVSVWDDISTVYLAAQYLGIDKGNPDVLYSMSDDQLQQAKAKLLEMKPNVRAYWSTGGDLTNMFANGEVVVAVGWPLVTQDLKKLGKNVGETIPKEGTTGWIDHWLVTAASQNKDLAHQFIEYMIQGQTMKLVADVTNYGVSNPEAAVHMSQEQAAGIHLDDPDSYMARINFWQSVPRRDQYLEIWNEVKNG